MQHTTIGNTTTFYSTTEESRINTAVSSNNIKFLVKFTNDFSKNVKFAYAQNENINNRYTSFELYHNTTENILEGKVNLQPAGYWTYEIFEISFINTPTLTETTAPLSDIIVLTPSDDNGINNGRIEIGKLLSSETDLGKEVTYNEYSSDDGDSYIYPFADSTTDNVVYGCTNINSANYNANATVDDGSCTFHIYGCMDSNANNYDPNATIENGSCTFDITGCTDSNASNYDPTATVDDGSCTFDVEGCTNPAASNYDPLANVDDGSCITFENTKSILFDGVTSSMSIPSSSDWETTNEMSIFAWVKLADWDDGTNYSFFSSFISGTGVKFEFSNRKIEARIRAGGSNRILRTDQNSLRTGGAQHTANNWHHIGLTFDGQFVKLYIDGVLDVNGDVNGVIDIGSAGNVINHSSVGMFVGASTSNLKFLDGFHDDLATWSNSLTDAEVLAIYNSGSVLDVSADSGNYTSSSNLTGWWRMGDDDTLPTITDNSTNSNNGTTSNVSASDISTDVPS